MTEADRDSCQLCRKKQLFIDFLLYLWQIQPYGNKDFAFSEDDIAQNNALFDFFF